MTSPREYGMLIEQTMKIIDATNVAIGKMDTLRSTIQHDAADYVARANQSDSGRITQMQLHQWNEDFGRVVQDLYQLNQRMDDLRVHNIATQAQAADAANAGNASSGNTQ
jgi:hypothetical protein